MKLEGKKAIWSEYQKEIEDDHYFYVRSCIRQNFFPGSEVAFLRIMRDVLKKDVYEHPCHTTCSGIGYHGDVVPVDTAMTVVARQFALMTEAGYSNYVPSCITSFGLYTEILDTWHHFPEVIAAVHAGLKVLGLSVVTDSCLPDALEPADLKKIIAVADKAEPVLVKLIEKVLQSL